MGKFVYKNKECMDKMHEFYDKALNSLNINYPHKGKNKGKVQIT